MLCCCSVDVIATTLYVRHHQLVGNVSFPFNVYFVFPRALSPMRLIPDLTIRVTRLPLATTWGIVPLATTWGIAPLVSVLLIIFALTPYPQKPFKIHESAIIIETVSYMKCLLDLLYSDHCI